MRRVTMVLILLLALMGLTMQAALASTSGAHFFSATASVNDGGALVVSWDETGLGNENINYTLNADSTAVYACINNGGQHPKASNKESVNGSVSTGGSFQSKNGRVQGSLTAGPLTDPSFTCPSGHVKLGSVNGPAVRLPWTRPFLDWKEPPVLTEPFTDSLLDAFGCCPPLLM